MIGGFEEPTSGSIFLGDHDVVGLPPYKRNVNTVFQSYALFPHLSIFENVAFGMRRQGVRGEQLAGRVRGILELVDLEGMEKRKPRQLSGGQQQRVALARALVNKPDVLLLDEPLGALDLKLRKQMQLELKAIQHDVGITFVHVTHDQEEAMTMADTIAVMNKGRIEQLGPPDELYEQPKTAFVAGFLGVSNLLSGTASGPGAITLDGGTTVKVSPEALNGRTGRVAVGIRPEKIRIGTGSPERAPREGLRARVRRRRDPVRRRHPRGAGHGLRPEHRARARSWRAPGDPISHRLRSRSHVCRRPCRGGSGVKHRLTREELLRRAAFGAALASIPGFAAACGGSSSSSGSSSGRTRSSPTRSASRTGRSTSTSTRRRSRIRDARRVHEEDGRQGRLHRGHQLELRVLREDPGPALARPVDQPRHHRPHRQRALPRRS